ncbi:MAG: hypothetical protein OZ948_13890 [Deltaproteobacteria bacterium]|nr:hypothetical protein [Deltaproteobacteria bacterium]
MPALTFGYDGFEAQVCTPSPTLLTWLEEFLSPWFTTRVGPPHAGAPRVVVEIDADLLAGRLAGAEPTGQAAEVFTHDDPQPPWPLLRAGDAGTLAADPRGCIAIGVKAAGPGSPRTVHALVAAERPHGRLVALRALRELASAYALASGALPIHGAALAGDAGVTLFVGRRKAGKSTLLLHALLEGGGRFVANDRVFVGVSARGADVRGMPTIVSLREGTLALFPQLRGELDSKTWHWSGTLEETRARRRSGRPAEGAGDRWPPGLSPPQLCALLGVAARAGDPLVRIVLPAVVAESGSPRFALRRLAPDEAAARLLATGLVAGGRLAPFVAGAQGGGRDALAAPARALAATVPCFACALGPDAYAPPPVWEAIRGA